MRQEPRAGSRRGPRGGVAPRPTKSRRGRGDAFDLAVGLTDPELATLVIKYFIFFFRSLGHPGSSPPERNNSYDMFYDRDVGSCPMAEASLPLPEPPSTTNQQPASNERTRSQGRSVLKPSPLLARPSRHARAIRPRQYHLPPSPQAKPPTNANIIGTARQCRRTRSQT